MNFGKLLTIILQTVILITIKRNYKNCATEPDSYALVGTDLVENDLLQFTQQNQTLIRIIFNQEKRRF